MQIMQISVAVCSYPGVSTTGDRMTCHRSGHRGHHPTVHTFLTTMHYPHMHPLFYSPNVVMHLLEKQMEPLKHFVAKFTDFIMASL